MESARQIITACTTLKQFWNKRDEKFKDWYRLTRMVDELAQKNMESFVGNDPRASYNLLLGMLEQKIPHRILPEELSQEQVAPAIELSRIFDKAWDDVFNQYRMRGKRFLRELIGFLLTTGWYSVFATMSLDGSRCVAEIWHPATVYQNWDDTLVECAHIFRLSKAQAEKMIARNNWKSSLLVSSNTIYDYWRVDNNRVFNSIVLNKDTVKPETLMPKFKRIPIFTAPVGGLPDTGEMASRGQLDDWKGEVGQSYVAANENIYRSWDKWWSFSMQLLRDTAQARTYEKSAGAQNIVKPEDWYRRGAHFKLGPQDEIGFIAPPPIPVELRSMQLDMEAMMQRGGPSWAMFGSTQQQMSAYVMSQISASMSHISKPYHDGVIDCITDIDNFWRDMIEENDYKPYGIGLPEGLPEDARLSAEYEIKIPGALIQRVTTARIMNPAFELSDEKIMEELFPEIKSPADELAKVRAGKARRHPVHAIIASIESFREEAEILRKAGDEDGAALYDKAAKLTEASLEVPPAEEEAPARETPARGFRPPGARPEVIPPPAPEPPSTI